MRCQGFLGRFDVAAVLVHNGVDDLLGQRLIAYLEILQKLTLHGYFLSPLRFVDGGRVPCGWP